MHIRIPYRPLVVLLISAACLFGAVPSGFAAARGSDLVGGQPASVRGVPSALLPSVAMKEGELVTSDGTVLWARTPTERRPMASITKIMTAVVAMENASPDLMITVPKIAAKVGESTADLQAGQVLPLRVLLRDLLVKSGNDAADTIAIGVGGSVEKFVAMMNAKAAQLGLKDTHFANPHGLDAPGHYTTAADLGVLARYAMTKQMFRGIVSVPSIVIGTGKNAHRAASTNTLLTNYAGANGVKTGFTNGAGYSFLASAQRNGVELYAVVLGTGSDKARFAEARTLLDWGFAHYRPQTLASAGTVVSQTRVSDYLDTVVPDAVSSDATATVFDLDGPITRTVSAQTSVRAPVSRGQRLGLLTFTQRGRVIASAPLVATQDVAAPNWVERVGIAFQRLWRAVSGGARTSSP